MSKFSGYESEMLNEMLDELFGKLIDSPASYRHTIKYALSLLRGVLDDALFPMEATGNEPTQPTYGDAGLREELADAQREAAGYLKLLEAMRKEVCPNEPLQLLYDNVVNLSYKSAQLIESHIKERDHANALLEHIARILSDDQTPEKLYSVIIPRLPELTRNMKIAFYFEQSKAQRLESYLERIGQIVRPGCQLEELPQIVATNWESYRLSDRLNADLSADWHKIKTFLGCSLNCTVDDILSAINDKVTGAEADAETLRQECKEERSRLLTEIESLRCQKFGLEGALDWVNNEVNSLAEFLGLPEDTPAAEIKQTAIDRMKYQETWAVNVCDYLAVDYTATFEQVKEALEVYRNAPAGNVPPGPDETPVCDGCGKDGPVSSRYADDVDLCDECGKSHVSEPIEIDTVRAWTPCAVCTDRQECATSGRCYREANPDSVEEPAEADPAILEAIDDISTEGAHTVNLPPADFQQSEPAPVEEWTPYNQTELEKWMEQYVENFPTPPVPEGDTLKHTLVEVVRHKWPNTYPWVAKGAAEAVADRRKPTDAPPSPTQPTQADIEAYMTDRMNESPQLDSWKADDRKAALMQMAINELHADETTAGRAANAVIHRRQKQAEAEQTVQRFAEKLKTGSHLAKSDAEMAAYVPGGDNARYTQLSTRHIKCRVELLEDPMLGLLPGTAAYKQMEKAIANLKK